MAYSAYSMCNMTYPLLPQIPYFEWQTLKTEQAQVEFLKTNIFK